MVYCEIGTYSEYTYVNLNIYSGETMNYSFNDWAKITLGPEKQALLSNCHDLACSTLGEGVATGFESIISQTGVEGNQEVIDAVYAEMLEQLVVSINQFGIILNDSELSIEHLRPLSMILEALLQIDQYELPNEILDLHEGADDDRSFVIELITRVVEVDDVDIEHLFYEIPKSLVNRILEITKERLAVADLDMIPEPQDVNRIVIERVAQMLDEPSGIVDYYRNRHPMGYELTQYVTVFSEELYSQMDHRKSAALWILLWCYANKPLDEILNRINAFTEATYYDATRTVAVHREIRAVLQGLAQ